VVFVTFDSDFVLALFCTFLVFLDAVGLLLGILELVDEVVLVQDLFRVRLLQLS
jgi:hypothetical protein